MLHSRCCLRPGGLQSDFIYEEGHLPRLWPSVWVRWKGRVCTPAPYYSTSTRLNDTLHIRSDDCPYDDRYDTRTTCCLPHESFQQYIHALSSNSQSPDSNLAAATGAVAAPPISGDDQIDAISLLTAPEQTLANIPWGVDSFPTFEPSAGFSDPMDLNQQASTELVWYKDLKKYTSWGINKLEMTWFLFNPHSDWKASSLSLRLFLTFLSVILFAQVCRDFMWF